MPVAAAKDEDAGIRIILYMESGVQKRGKEGMWLVILGKGGNDSLGGG